MHWKHSQKQITYFSQNSALPWLREYSFYFSLPGMGFSEREAYVIFWNSQSKLFSSVYRGVNCTHSVLSSCDQSYSKSDFQKFVFLPQLTKNIYFLFTWNGRDSWSSTKAVCWERTAYLISSIRPCCHQYLLIIIMWCEHVSQGIPLIIRNEGDSTSASHHQTRRIFKE